MKYAVKNTKGEYAKMDINGNFSFTDNENFMYLLPSEQDAERLVKFLGNEKLKVEELKK
jgi:hypothetical protein